MHIDCFCLLCAAAASLTALTREEAEEYCDQQTGRLPYQTLMYSRHSEQL